MKILDLFRPLVDFVLARFAIFLLWATITNAWVLRLHHFFHISEESICADSAALGNGFLRRLSLNRGQNQWCRAQTMVFFKREMIFLWDDLLIHVSL